MAFCNNCGNQIPDNATVCPACGAPVMNVQPQQGYAQPQYQQTQQGYAQPQYQQPQQNYAQPQQNYAQPQQAQPQQNYAQPQYQQPQQAQPQQGYAQPADPGQSNDKMMGIFAYIGLLFLIPLFAAKNSKFARFHTGQGATLCAFEVAYNIVSAILQTIFNSVFVTTYTSYWGYYTYTAPSTLANVLCGLLAAANAFFVVLAIIGIVNASKGKMVKLPIIGKIDIISKLIDK